MKFTNVYNYRRPVINVSRFFASTTLVSLVKKSVPAARAVSSHRGRAVGGAQRRERAQAMRAVAHEQAAVLHGHVTQRQPHSEQAARAPAQEHAVRVQPGELAPRHPAQPLVPCMCGAARTASRNAEIESLSTARGPTCGDHCVRARQCACQLPQRLRLQHRLHPLPARHVLEACAAPSHTPPRSEHARRTPSV
jgi:hypothetical protein